MAFATSDNEIHEFDAALLLIMDGCVVALSVTGCRSWRSHNRALGQLSAIVLWVGRIEKTTLDGFWYDLCPSSLSSRKKKSWPFLSVHRRNRSSVPTEPLLRQAWFFEGSLRKLLQEVLSILLSL